MDVRQVPALLPAMALVAGAVFGLRAAWAPPALALALAGGGVAWRGRAGAALAACAVGMLAATVGPPAAVPTAIDPARPVTAVGRVADHWLVDGDEASVRFRLARLRQGPVVERTAVEVRLVMPAGDGLPETGSELRVKGSLRRSPGFANGIPTPPGPWRLRAKSRRLVEVLDGPGPMAALSARWRARVETAQAAAVRIADERETGERGAGAALARALVLADPSGLPESWRRGLRRAGLAHLLAVSGLHVGLVAGTVLLAGAFLPWRPRLVLGLLAIVAYLLLAGPRPALLRAALMGGLAAVALLAARVPSGANALAVAAAALVLARPALLDDLGFRLTATATAGILFLAPALARRWCGAGADDGGADDGGADPLGRDGEGDGRPRDGRAGPGAGRGERPSRRPRRGSHLGRHPGRLPGLGRGFGLLRRLLAPPLAATVAAQLVSLPAAAPAFHLLSWTAPLTNLVAVPWTAAALAVSLAWTAAALASPPLAAALLPVLDLVAAPFGWPALGPPARWGTLAVAAPPWAALLLAGLGALWLVAPRRRPRPRRFHLPLFHLPLLAALLLLLPVFRWGGEGPARHAGLEAVFLDVGQGDAILLRDGPRTLLVDGGGWPSGDLGGRVLVPALVGEGVARLDAVLLTHPDRDHCRGLVDLASYLAIGEAWLARGLERRGCAGELAAAVEGQGGRVREVAAGDRHRLGRWRLDVLHPPAPDAGAGAGATSGSNDDSIVVLAAAAGRRLLLTGDVEAPAERRLVRRSEDLLRADVLKLAHHGSKSSTGAGFLAVVAPRLAIASAGHGNSYGHPADLVRRRLRQRRVPLLRTDHHGMIHLELLEPAPEGPRPAGAPPPLRLRLGRLWPLAEPPP